MLDPVTGEVADDTEVYRFRNWAIPLETYFQKLEARGMNEKGEQVPDPTIMEPPIGYEETPDLVVQIRNMVRRELSERAGEEGFETFEESDDFEVDDDDPTSPYEEVFEPAPGTFAKGVPDRAPEAPVSSPPASSAAPPAQPAASSSDSPSGK